MTPHLSVNNLTMVSDLFYDDCDKMEEVESPVVNGHLKYNRGLCVSLNRCRVKMAGIRRETKELVLSNGTLLPYDILLLCTGKCHRPEIAWQCTEFRSPDIFRRKDNSAAHVLNFTLGAQHGGVHNEEPGLDGAQLGKLIREMTENAESRVFIRGTTLTALATIKRLTDRGIDPGNLLNYRQFIIKGRRLRIYIENLFRSNNIRHGC